jgi:hypothetical protein
MKLSRKLKSFLQFTVQDGFTEATRRTRTDMYRQYKKYIVRGCFVPLIGKTPELYRAYTYFHPRFSDVDPFKTILVSQQRITHTSKKSGEHLYGRVIGGAWDSPARSLAKDDTYRGLREYIQTGDATTYIEKFKKKRRFAGWKYPSSNSVSNRLHDVDILIKSLRENGYLLQSEIDTDEMKGDYSSDRPNIINEITVSIGRDGTFYYNFMGGSHRLFISKIIGIEYIPVQVAVRHTRWQEIRDTIRHSDTLSDVPAKYREYLVHPDIRDIHPSA